MWICSLVLFDVYSHCQDVIYVHREFGRKAQSDLGTMLLSISRRSDKWALFALPTAGVKLGAPKGLPFGAREVRDTQRPAIR